jgi:hypothetical protein
VHVAGDVLFACLLDLPAVHLGARCLI